MRKEYSDGTKVLSFKEAEELLKSNRIAGLANYIRKKQIDKSTPIHIPALLFLTSSGSNRISLPGGFRRERHLKYSSSGSNRISLPEVVISLIGSGKKLHGNIRLQKELFIAFNERFPKELNVEPPRFVPYRLGPYSFKIASIMEGLIMGGYVKTSGRKGSNKQVYELTKKGEMFFDTVKMRNPKLVEMLSEVRKDMDEFSTKGILRYIYNNPAYEKYLSKSQYKDKYKDITWGRGKG